MRTMMIAAALILQASIGKETITASQAKAHEGENAAVCGTVADQYTATGSKGAPTFINLDSSYPHQLFTILIWGDDRSKVGALPQTGSHVCATGLIQDYKGIPEIIVHNRQQLNR